MILSNETLDEIIRRMSENFDGEIEKNTNNSSDDENAKLEKYQRQTTEEER